MKVLFFSMLLLYIFNAQANEPVTSYKQSLENFLANSGKGKSPFSASDKQIMKNAADQLAVSMPGPGIKVGEKAPDFSLPNAFGKKVVLSDELKKGPVVLVFYRGAWCPFCNMHLHVLHKNLANFKQYGAQLIMVTPQKPDKSAEQIKKDGYPFEVLSDLDSQVIKNYKLFFKLDADLVAVYKKAGLDIETYNGEGRNELPVPGSFVIDKKGIVRAMHATADYKQRMEPADIIKALSKL